jgi:MFS family permease
MFDWYRQASEPERRTFRACFAGWSVDALDAQMLSLAIPTLITAFALDKSEAGLMSAVTLVASGIGGWLAGALSDRIGRVRTLQLTIVWFSVFAFLSSVAWSANQLLVLKALQGFGFGGEWAAGAVLMAEVIRAEHRGKAMGLVQSAWAVGWGAAVLLYAALFYWLPATMAWRILFALGALPALLVLYIRRAVVEPPATVAKRRLSAGRRDLFAVFSPRVLRVTLVGALLGVGAHGGYYALTTWLPTYLRTERHLSVLNTGGYLAVIIVAFWCGCAVSAYLSDRIGRRANIALFAVCCGLTVSGYLLAPLNNSQMLALGFPLGFFAAGIPATLGALFSELYPTEIRGAGVGLCYNFGRIVSAAFPVLVGYMSASMPLGMAIGIAAVSAYALVVAAALALPETRGTHLDRQDPATIDAQQPPARPGDPAPRAFRSLEAGSIYQTQDRR